MGKPRKKKVVVETPAPQELCTITVTVGKEVYTASGHSLVEAFKKFPVPPKIVAKALLEVREGERRFRRLFFPLQMRRFLYPAFREIHAKEIAGFLK